MEQDRLFYLSRYPFLSASREYVASMGMSLDSMLAHPIYSASLDGGKNRVTDCLKGGFKPRQSDMLQAELALLSYPVARMLAQSMGKSINLSYSAGEADAAYVMLLEEDEDTVTRVAADLGLDLADGRMPVFKYVRLAATLAKRNPKWKLTNRSLHAGLVDVEPQEVRALLREAIRERVMERIDPKKVPSNVKKEALSLKASILGAEPEVRVESLEHQALPPCIGGVITLLASGEASHNAMFLLATFLANLGLPKSELMAVFRKSPKFDEEKTEYQLSFITGDSGATKYTCPSCPTVKSQGLCRAECRVTHPLQYYRQHAKERPRIIRRPPAKQATGKGG